MNIENLKYQIGDYKAPAKYSAKIRFTLLYEQKNYNLTKKNTGVFV